MHAIKESIVMLSEVKKYSNISYDLRDFYLSKVIKSFTPSSKWSVEVLLRGWVGRYINERENKLISIDIFENNNWRVVPTTKIKSYTKIDSTGYSIAYHLYSCGIEISTIDKILTDFKFNFGPFSSSKEQISVLVDKSLVSVRYLDKSKFDMLDNFSKLDIEASGFTSNFGGLEHVSKLLNNPNYSISDRTEGEYRIIELECISKFSSEKTFMKIDSTDLSWIFNPTKLKSKLNIIEENPYPIFQFVLEIIANVIYYNSRDFSEVYAINYEEIGIPILVPVGYECGLDI